MPLQCPKFDDNIYVCKRPGSSVSNERLEKNVHNYLPVVYDFVLILFVKLTRPFDCICLCNLFCSFFFNNEYTIYFALNLIKLFILFYYIKPHDN